MKLALIRQDYHKHGGAERYLYHLSRELAQRGHEVHIFACTGEEVVNKNDNFSGKLIFRTVFAWGGAGFLRALSFAFSVRRLLQKERFDVIHSFDRTLYQDIYRAGDGCHREWLKTSLGISSSLWERFSVCLNPLHPVLLFLERNLFRNCKRIIAISRGGKEEIIRNYGVSPSKITVIYNGVDSEEFNPQKAIFREEVRAKLGLSQDDKIILFVGSGFRRKGLRALIESMAYLKKKNTKLLVVGKDKQGQYLRLVKKLGLQGKVIFAGGLPETNKLYAAADIFAFPTLYEPFGNVCLEALASALPLIVSRSSGAAEIITEGQEGFLLDNPRNAREIAEKIDLALDAETWKNLSKNARELAGKYTWEKNVDLTLKIYEEVISEKGQNKKIKFEEKDYSGYNV